MTLQSKYCNYKQKLSHGNVSLVAYLKNFLECWTIIPVTGAHPGANLEPLGVGSRIVIPIEHHAHVQNSRGIDLPSWRRSLRRRWRRRQDSLQRRSLKRRPLLRCCGGWDRKDGCRLVAQPNPVGVAGEGVVVEEQLRYPVVHAPQAGHLWRDLRRGGLAERTSTWSVELRARARRPPRGLGGHCEAAGAHGDSEWTSGRGRQSLFYNHCSLAMASVTMGCRIFEIFAISFLASFNALADVVVRKNFERSRVN